MIDMTPDERVIAAMDALVAENPDFVYNPPGLEYVYAKDGLPSCGIGHLLHRLGVKFRDLDTDYLGETWEIIEARTRISSELKQTLILFQVHQDNGLSWRRAWDEAKY